MSETERGNPIQAAVVILLLVGGGWYFLRHYEIEGLDEISISSKVDSVEEPGSTFIAFQSRSADASGFTANRDPVSSGEPENPFDRSTKTSSKRLAVTGTGPRQPAPLRIASWALDGFGPTKLANPVAMQNLAKVARNFDILALQQISSIERDLVSRMVDAINHGEGRYDYVLGKSTGPDERPEQIAIVFDTTRVLVDRQQTYTVQDPTNGMTFDPLVAWFRAAEPSSSQAWTFSLVNVRIDLARAPAEVALLRDMMEAIRADGRGEDDVVMLGLFQADDAYLLPLMGGSRIRAAVSHRPTDLFGKYQTSNIIVDSANTSEFLGRGGVLEFHRLANLNDVQAESISSQLPVFGEFSAIEGIHLAP
jgi:hypothetical protein